MAAAAQTASIVDALESQKQAGAPVKSSTTCGDKFRFEIDIEDQPDTNADIPEAASATSAPALASTTLRRPTRLMVYDFDSTLFRSPLPNPDLWAPDVIGTIISECGWFQEPKTLSPPYLPEIPDETWWDADMLRSAQESLSRPHDTITVLLTGRRHDRFSARIEHMCRGLSNPLNFDMFFLREGNDPNGPRHFTCTLDFKLAVLRKLLTTFPTIDHIELFDDRKRHLELFERELKALVQQRQQKPDNNVMQISSYRVHHIIQDAELEQHMPPSLEKQLVDEMIMRANTRTLAARSRVCGSTESVTTPVGATSTEVKAGSEQTKEQQQQETSRVALSNVRPQSAGGQQQQSNSTTTTPRVTRKRQISFSAFRNVIHIVPETRYTAITLDPASQARISETFPRPDCWARHAKHMILCGSGAPKPEVVDPLGGVGARVMMRVVGLGEVPGKAVAVKVDQLTPMSAPPSSSSASDSGSDTEPGLVTVTTTSFDSTCPRSPPATSRPILLYLAPGVKKRESNTITAWKPLPNPLFLTGTITVKTVMGLKKDGSKHRNQKKEVSIGDLVLKYYPTLKGRAVGLACREVEQWMEKGFMENADQNRAAIECWIANHLDVGKVVAEANSAAAGAGKPPLAPAKLMTSFGGNGSAGSLFSPTSASPRVAGSPKRV
ncbi:hypothetical protein HK102_005426 [Quaeritorhiza haematococci]|nr:hypothetical protein HK102_005426 [Quaeritorhiza haematococci]